MLRKYHINNNTLHNATTIGALNVSTSEQIVICIEIIDALTIAGLADVIPNRLSAGYGHAFGGDGEWRLC